jgi:heptaprenyl diphosphate synthase
MTPAEIPSLEPLTGDLERVETALRASVSHSDQFLGDVAAHLVQAGGKRVRPMLTLCAAYATKGAGPVHDDVVTGAVAVELVHLGSLHHDDVIDESQTRRGVPSVNARWSNIVAILSGDYLLARASVLAASLGAEVAGLLASTIGELCRGQVLELQHLFNVARSEEDYVSTIEGKTASLFATSCRIGGMVSDVDEPTLDALTRYGYHAGMCFQVVDDVLDLTGSAATLGKPSGRDLIQGVYTLPVIHALGDTPALAGLLGGPLDDAAREEARRLATSNGAVDSALAVARDHAKKAGEALAGAHELDRDVTCSLRQLVEDLVGRPS